MYVHTNRATLYAFTHINSGGAVAELSDTTRWVAWQLHVPVVESTGGDGCVVVLRRPNATAPSFRLSALQGIDTTAR
jgi:hypothetical protein